jgi:hypothetical protein
MWQMGARYLPGIEDIPVCLASWMGLVNGLQAPQEMQEPAMFDASHQELAIFLEL